MHKINILTNKVTRRAIAASAIALSLSVIAVILVGHALKLDTSLIILPASLGAAAVLMFMAPASPMASLRTFILANLLSATIGISFYTLWGDHLVVAVFSVCTAILLMQLFRCQHPPGGATALLTVVSGDQILAQGYAFLLYPFGLCLLIFVIIALVHRHTLKEQGYNRSLSVINHSVDRPDPFPGIIEALALEDQISKVEAEKLCYLFNLSNQHGLTSNSECKDLPIERQYVYFDTRIEDALRLFKPGKINTLAVIDSAQKPIGALHLADLLHIAGLTHEAGMEQLHEYYSYQGTLESVRIQHTGQAMKPVNCIQINDNALETLARLQEDFCVVDEKGKLYGFYIHM